MFVLMGLTINAQVYFFEDFEAETEGNEPSNFTVYNEDACNINNPTIFPNGSWTVLTDGVGTQGLTAQAQSWTVPPCQVDDWLITSAIDLTTASAATDLTWKGVSNEGPTYPETYEVRLSTTGTAVADFTTVLLNVPGELETWTSHTVNLAPYIGGTVYVAFRLISTDKSAVSIDDIRVSEPPAFDLQIQSKTTNATPQRNNYSNTEYLIVDFVNRTSFESEFTFVNSGLNAIDSIYLTYFLVDDINNPSQGVAFGDTVYLAAPLASGATYTHTFEAFGIDTLFPNLASNQFLDFYVQIDSSSYNYITNEDDFRYSAVVSPTESYSAPYSNSFEIADLNAGQFIFDHSTWGWKYLDVDNNGNNFSVRQFTDFVAYDQNMFLFGVPNGPNDVAQSPNISLTNGSFYSFSVWARSGFGFPASAEVKLTDANGTFTSTLGNISLTAADSTWRKINFSYTATSTQDDFLIEITNGTGSLIGLDLFEFIELQAPTATLNLSGTDEPGVEYCDSTVSVGVTTSGNPTSVSLDWGDGTVDDISANPNGTYNHTYATTGNYTIAITATSIAGSANDDVALAFTDVPAPTVTFNTPQLSGNTVTVSIGSVASNLVVTPSCVRVIIDWGDGTIDEVTGQTTASHTYAAAGDYTVTATALGATQATGTQTLTVTGISNINFASELNMYPNPVNNFLNVDFALNANEDVELSVIAVDGKVIETLNFNNASVVNTKINTASINNGVYILKIKTENGISTQKFVVSHK